MVDYGTTIIMTMNASTFTRVTATHITAIINSSQFYPEFDQEDFLCAMENLLIYCGNTILWIINTNFTLFSDQVVCNLTVPCD